MGGCGLDSYASEFEPETGFCEQENEPLVYIKLGELLIS
jgi:hypothetical protein